ncbi:MAG: glycosyltransferase [Ignavibacteriales bacterium]|nr:glycosyltransferase [Ignavibacteriales bacterium]
MKILIITTQIPFPPFRGDKLKIFNICKILVKRNEVKVVTFLRKSSEARYVEELKEKGINVEVVKFPYFKSILNLFRSVISAVPFQVSAFYSKKMQSKIFELTSVEKYDVIYFHLINTAQYLPFINDIDALKVIDFTDALSLYLTRYLDYVKNPIKKMIYKLELGRIIRYEKTAKSFDTLFICSDVDKDFLARQKIHDNIQCLLNGFDENAFKYEFIQAERFRIVFSGNMPYFPNQDAALYFVKEIFPIVLLKVPTAKFYIVGQNPPKEILDLQSENIIVTGFVSDIKKEYLLSEVNVAPIRIGAGTPNKIIESLALGIPTVATSMSVNGFPDELKKFVFTADTPELFAARIIDIFNDGSIRGRLMKEGSELVHRLLGWNRIVENFEDYLNERVEIKREK